MSKKSSAAAEMIDPEAEYTVQLLEPIKIGPTWLRPRAERIRLKGSTLLAHRAAVGVYEIVKPRS